MKHGSIVNEIQANSRQPEPAVGMGATFYHWSDRSAGTVVTVERKGNTVIVGVRPDTATRVDSHGMSEWQTYTFAPCPEAPLCYFRSRKGGRWEHVYRAPSGRWKIHKGGPSLGLGERDAYHDFSF